MEIAIVYLHHDLGDMPLFHPFYRHTEGKHVFRTFALFNRPAHLKAKNRQITREAKDNRVMQIAEAVSSASSHF